MTARRRLDVTVTLSAEQWAAVEPVLAAASACRRQPRTWRDSEAAMTFAAAVRNIAAVRGQIAAGGSVTMTHDDWDDVTAAIARLWRYSRRWRDQAGEAYGGIRAAIADAPGVAELEAVLAEEGRLDRAIRRAERVAKVAKRRLWAIQHRAPK